MAIFSTASCGELLNEQFALQRQITHKRLELVQLQNAILILVVFCHDVGNVDVARHALPPGSVPSAFKAAPSSLLSRAPEPSTSKVANCSYALCMVDSSICCAERATTREAASSSKAAEEAGGGRQRRSVLCCAASS